MEKDFQKYEYKVNDNKARLKKSSFQTLLKKLGDMHFTIAAI